MGGGLAQSVVAQQPGTGVPPFQTPTVGFLVLKLCDIMLGC